jgi:hypothetical protein
LDISIDNLSGFRAGRYEETLRYILEEIIQPTPNLVKVIVLLKKVLSEDWEAQPCPMYALKPEPEEK